MKVATLAQLILLGMIWGSSFLFQRITVPAVGAGMTASVRTLLAAIVLVGGLIVLRKSLNWRARWRDYLLVGFCSTGIPLALFALAAYALPAGYSAVLNATVPMFAVLIGWIGAARPSSSKLAGVVVGVLGVATLARFGPVAMSLATFGAFAAGLGAAVLYAIGARAAKARFADADPLSVAGGNLIGAALPLLPFGVATFPTSMPTPGVLVSLLVLGVVCTGLAYALYFRLIRDAGSERATTVTFIVPVFAQIWGALFLGEAITFASVVGSALVLFAVALIFERVPGFARAPVAVVPEKLCEEGSV
jgi:drug/metabolite transporter (DMT)-like permease